MNEISPLLKVADIRNTLSHVKVTDNLGIEQKQTDTYFQALADLVNCLITLHPYDFSTDLLQELKKVRLKWILLLRIPMRGMSPF